MGRPVARAFRRGVVSLTLASAVGLAAPALACPGYGAHAGQRYTSTLAAKAQPALAAQAAAATRPIPVPSVQLAGAVHVPAFLAAAASRPWWSSWPAPRLWRGAPAWLESWLRL